MAKALFTIKKIEFIRKHKFARIILDENSKTFIVCGVIGCATNTNLSILSSADIYTIMR